MNYVKNSIGWCDYTWNPLTGCLNNCSYCYARKIFRRFKKSFIPQIHYNRLSEPLFAKPSRIFVCSVSDFWGKGIPQIWREEIYNVIKACPQHTFQILTKQPQNITDDDINHCPEENVWIGVTNTGGEYESIYDLQGIPMENKKFISFEPLLKKPLFNSLEEIGWIILGAQTNPYLAPKIEWLNEIIEYAEDVFIPIFMKSNLSKVWDGDLIQELPK